MRKLAYQIAVILMVLAPLVLACACQAPAASKPAEIRWWHMNTDQPGIDAFNAIARSFEAANPGLKVTTVPVDNLEYRQKLQVELSADDPPELFASWGGGGMAEQARAGKLRDITDWVKSPKWKISINPAILELYTWQGRIYGFPQDFGAIGFWYNADMLAKAGFKDFPADWDGLLAMVRSLKRQRLTPIALGVSDHWPGGYYWYYLSLRIAGPGLFQDILEGKRSFTDPALVQGGKLLVDLARLEPFQPGALGDDYAAQSRLMGDGKAAMQLMGQWALGVQAQNADAKDALNGVMRFAAFPAVRGGKGSILDAMGGANGFVVGKNAPDGAIALLAWLDQPEQLQIYVDAFPFIPTVPGVQIKNPALQAVSNYLQKASSFTFYPDQTYPSTVNAAMNQLSSRMIVGELSPEQACAELQAIWEKSRLP